MKKLKVGIIGAGAISRDHCRGVTRHPDAEMAAVADLSEKRASALQQEFGMARAYTRWRDLVRDRELDAVVVALPNALHAPVAIAALQAGKHVLLEKPFALSLAQAQAVVAEAKKARKVLMLGMNQRYTRDAQTVKTLVGRGDLGDIYHGKAVWLRRSGTPKFGTWFSRKKESGGGCLLDIGVHLLDLCLFLMDQWKPAAVSGKTYGNFGRRAIGEGDWGHSDRGAFVFDVDDFATALIKFPEGQTVTLDVSWVMHQESASRMNVELYGTEAGACVYPAKLLRFGANKGEYEVVSPQNVPIAMEHCCRQMNWVDAVLKRDKPLCTLEQALVVQRVLDAVYESSETGREVRLR